jgi:hypothetical protein
MLEFPRSGAMPSWSSAPPTACTRSSRRSRPRSRATASRRSTRRIRRCRTCFLQMEFLPPAREAIGRAIAFLDRHLRGA